MLSLAAGDASGVGVSETCSTRWRRPIATASAPARRRGSTGFAGWPMRPHPRP